jgi:Ala-tRNA(Pro) deacylase
MAATPQELFAFLDSLAIAYRTVTHPPLFTVADSQKLRGTIPGAHTKNLLLRDKHDTVVLVAALEDAVIDLKGLHHQLGAARFSFASATVMRALIGVEPGAVTPFAAINDKARQVSVVLDAAMMAERLLNYHLLVNTMTTGLSSEDLVKFLEATGHRPRIVAMADAAGRNRQRRGEMRIES